MRNLIVPVAAAAAVAFAAVPAQAAETPTCVTRAEYRAISKGDTKARVTRVFDIAGRQDAKSVSSPGGYGAMIRSYKTCSRFSAVSISFTRANWSAPWRVSYKSAIWS